MMNLNDSNKNNFWNSHTLNDFQQLLIYNNVHSSKITAVCFLKDGSLASASDDKYVYIYNKNTFEKEITIKENKRIDYININKDGILIVCLSGTYLYLYEIKNKNIKIFKQSDLIVYIMILLEYLRILIQFKNLLN